MFQYAAGLALALDHGQTLKLDIGGYIDYHLHHGFELQNVFNCTADIATVHDVRVLIGWQSLPLVMRLLSQPCMNILRSSALIVEPHFNYWSGIGSVPGNCYLYGYWQSHKYFDKHTSELRKEFTFQPPLNDKNQEIASQILTSHAVSLHVRRCDYQTNPKNIHLYHVCTLDYYRSAIDYISNSIDRPVFIVFSDDMDWVKENLHIDGPTQYIDHNRGSDSFNDMRLMSLCQHHIIANSTFSWWGAWLNADPDKTVVAPRQWFKNCRMNSIDLIPNNWILI